jgi:glycosyltransferase involved in cell wall biosynthesis
MPDTTAARPTTSDRISDRIHLSVIVKAYNEQKNISRCLQSIFDACRLLSFEVIVADARSEDATVERAAPFAALIVALADIRDRGCGTGTQLGYQFASGEIVLVLDGDMVVRRDFILRALQRFEAEPLLAGVGGLLEEKSSGIEFQLRRKRHDPTRYPGEVDHINGAGLYRAAAIREVGYLTNRNLHCCEEWELGMRLRHAGWRLRRLDCVAVEHYGHEQPWPVLLANRWRSRYAYGYGELLRAAIGKPYFLRAVRRAWKFIAVFLWWLAIAAAAISADTASYASLAGAAALVLGGPIFAIARKRSIRAGFYSFALWNVHAAGLIAGAWRPQVDPRSPIAAVVLHDRREAPALKAPA